jgi:hypothetical protein
MAQPAVPGQGWPGDPTRYAALSRPDLVDPLSPVSDLDALAARDEATRSGRGSKAPTTPLPKLN